MKQIIYYLLLFSYIIGYSQIKFEKGYIINDKGDRIDCLIKNEDWKNNPEEFIYKIDENSEILNGTLYNIKEFGIVNEFKFINANVNIALFSTNTNELDDFKNPVFNKTRIFLKEIVDGKYSLYVYSTQKNIYYFIKKNDEYEQLIYKKYLTDSVDIQENFAFRQQLYNYFILENPSLETFEKVKYEKKEILNIFQSIGKVSPENIVKEKVVKNQLKLHLQAGAVSQSLDLSSSGVFNGKTETKIGIIPGLEFEYVLPFNKNKWSLLMSTFFINYDGNGSGIHKVFLNSRKELINASYKSFNIGLGARHFMYLNDSSKLYINAIFNIINKSDGSIIIDNNNTFEVSDGNTSLSFGMGYNYKNRYSIECRYLKKNTIDYVSWNSNYNSISIILSYNILGNKN